jgi:hypothetical protein
MPRTSTGSTWLRDVEAGKIDASGAKAGMQGNGWCYDVLTSSRIDRRSLAQADRRNCSTVARSKHLLKAAELYARIDPVLVEADKCPWDLTLGPGRFKTSGPARLRQTQIKRLEQARELDRAAIAEITKALEVIEP